MIVIEAPDLKRLAVGAREFPKPLRASIRKQLTVIARTGANDSKSAIRGMPSKGTGHTGLRSAIAGAIRVSATANNSRGAAVSIKVAQTGALQAGNRYRVARLLDAGPFRHPVYGNRNNYVGQAGFPYFDHVLQRRAPEMRAAGAAALREATLATIPNVR